MIRVTSQDVAHTHAVASVIASLVRPRDIIVLSGPMGAGKTAFTRGFADALGVSRDDEVSSPTFTLVHEHLSGRIPVHHADLYRLGSTGEIADLGLRERADLGAVVLVEWGEVAGDVLGDHLIVELEPDDDDEDLRRITVSAVGHSWDSRWTKLSALVEAAA